MPTKRKLMNEFIHKEKAKQVNKDWDDIICPVCMNPPHNAVLLVCSSYDNGCRTFMCNNSYRHSNCLDQYRKSALKFICPCCRGEVIDSKVKDDLRTYMNTKIRECAVEKCEFHGDYGELRKHARLVHSWCRPNRVSFRRKRHWDLMMEDWEWEDSLTAVRPFHYEN
ncbi:putative transcription factor C2H2 family [Dioscorea sansibarensis]